MAIAARCALVALCVTVVGVLAGCSRSPHPLLVSGGGAVAAPRALAPSADVEYSLHVGDELRILVVGQPEFTGVVKVRPDGRISAPGAGDLQASGQTVHELTEELRAQLRRLIRYPDVSVMLTSYAEEVVYVLGEVNAPGDHAYMPDMTALHALGAAAGHTSSAALGSVLVLRRTGPNALDVYRLDLDAAVDGDPLGRDVFLRPYDVVFVPRNFIAEVNLFVDRFVRQNISPFTAYIEGWQAFHLEDIYWRASQ
ncbi:MAG: polysaccharide biosynthesis/export family protein [Candidatus Eisenbacteria sp.]|nr:polysaccharide biosynthesis/export family protein [Candidatus Eisenbacteria bacterium]